MSFHIKAGVTALALILAPLAVAAHHKAGHDGGNGRGHASQEDRGERGNGRANRDREDRQEETSGEEASEEEGDENEAGDDEEVGEEVAGGRRCGWGLAGRDTPCVPPGQARRGVTTDDWIGAPGTVVDDTTDLSKDLALLGNTDRLPDLEEGQSYALVGDAVIVVKGVEGVDETGATVTTYEYVSTYGRAAFPGQSKN